MASNNIDFQSKDIDFFDLYRFYVEFKHFTDENPYRHLIPRQAFLKTEVCNDFLIQDLFPEWKSKESYVTEILGVLEHFDDEIKAEKEEDASRDSSIVGR